MEDIGQCPALALVSSLDEAGCLDLVGVRGKPLQKQVLLLDADDPDQRARLLGSGFGDAVGSATSLAELEARALRLAETATALPRSRDLGVMRLDLFARDGFVGRRPLGLHPREFALIWRLAETPGVPIPKSELVADVWRMTYVPDTNSLAVHVFRLRTKLAVAGIDGLVQTEPSGGYFLAPLCARVEFRAARLNIGDRQERAGVHLSAG